LILKFWTTFLKFLLPMFDFRIFPTSKFFSFLALSWPQHTGIVLNSLSLTLVRIFLTHLLSLSEAVWWIIPARLIWYLEFSVIHFFCVKFPKESCVSPGYFKKDQKLIAYLVYIISGVFMSSSGPPDNQFSDTILLYANPESTQ
jgi:hypothetical protein